MTFVLFFLIHTVLAAIGIKTGIGTPDDTTLIIIAILTAGEVIARACETR